MRGLYAVIDADSLLRVGQEPVAFARELLRQPLAAIQLRSKTSCAKQTLLWLKGVCRVARSAGVPVYANDRPDLAMLAGCQGVHVGQNDLSVADVRALAPALRVGISTHSVAQVDAALRDNPDYLALGPIYPTRSKLNAEPVVGLETLKEVSELCRRRGVPLVAIGGIEPTGLARVSRWADAVALISAFVPQPGDSTTVVSRHAQLLQLLSP